MELTPQQIDRQALANRRRWIALCLFALAFSDAIAEAAPLCGAQVIPIITVAPDAAASLPADAVVVATGGCGLVYGRSTMSVFCTGSAASRCFQAGAKYGNGEFIQVHPTAIPGADKLRLMSESARGEGGRAPSGCDAQRPRASRR